MEGPGGYQFVGRTVQMWNRFRSTADFPPGQPWLLRLFDQIRFYPVEPRRAVADAGGFHPRPLPPARGGNHLPAKRIPRVPARNRPRGRRLQGASSRPPSRPSASAGRKRASICSPTKQKSPPPPTKRSCPTVRSAACAPLPANVWKVLVNPGDTVAEGDKLVILEAMKMEVAVSAPFAGTVSKILCTPGQLVTPGQALCWVKPFDPRLI